MARHEKNDGSVVIKGVDGRIVNNLPAGATQGPSITVTVEAPGGSRESTVYANVDDALAAFDQAILDGNSVVGFNENSPRASRQRGVLAEYEGRVLAWRERNGYDDSEFHALVEETPGVFRWIPYASTAYGDGGYAAPVDATDDVWERYEQAQATRAAEVLARREAREAAIKPAPGTPIIVNKGRKHKGRTGIVVAAALDKFKTNHRGDHYNVLVADNENNEFWVDVAHIELEHNGQWIEGIGHRYHSSRADEIDAYVALPPPSQIRP